MNNAPKNHKSSCLLYKAEPKMSGKVGSIICTCIENKECCEKCEAPGDRRFCANSSCPCHLPPKADCQTKCASICSHHKGRNLNKPCSIEFVEPQPVDWREEYWKLKISSLSSEEEAHEKIISFIEKAIATAVAEADICKQCGGKDMVCAKGVEDQIKKAVKEERESWINQPANQHDERIRKAERQRIVDNFPQEITYEEAKEMSKNVSTNKEGGVKWGYNEAIYRIADLISKLQ